MDKEIESLTGPDAGKPAGGKKASAAKAAAPAQAPAH